MKISAKGLYAVKAMIYIARHATDEPVSLSEIASEENISRKYLEQIMHTLSSAQLVVATRGKLGGYRLALPPNEISMFTILKATENSLSPGSSNEEQYICSVSIDPDLWKGLGDAIRSYLSDITLATILKDTQAQ